MSNPRPRRLRAAAASSELQGLRPLLDALDACLRLALQHDRAFETRAGGPADASLDPLVRAPGEPRYAATRARLPLCEPPGLRFGELARVFELSAFELDLLLLALAPEIDGRYGRLYGELCDEPSRRRPSAELALDLLCTDAADKLARRALLAPASRLLCKGLLLLESEAASGAPLLAQSLRPAPELVELLLGDADPAPAFAGMRERGHEDLGRYARRLPTPQGWDDLVLLDESMTALHELCARLSQHERVLHDWGFAQKMTLGRGCSALFAGPSGTGKTLAAGIIAHELGLPLYRIDLSQVVNKYIGETEKNLARVFDAAAAAGAILFFDEADALFGKRSEVKDAHDRYANLEVGYLLQKMEEYEGLAILATNLRQHLDEAFVRRLSFIVEFPFPDQAQRRRIWDVLVPASAPLAADVDFDWLAREVRLSGGHLRNIALAAAYLAASESLAISRDHLIRAARREHRKLGRSWEPAG